MKIDESLTFLNLILNDNNIELASIISNKYFKNPYPENSVLANYRSLANIKYLTYLKFETLIT